MNTDHLKGWDVQEQQRRTEFMEHMYKCSGRTNGLFTGLWQDFCLKEAGPYCRNLHFERLEAIENFIKMESLKETETFVPTLHD